VCGTEKEKACVLWGPISLYISKCFMFFLDPHSCQESHSKRRDCPSIFIQTHPRLPALFSPVFIDSRITAAELLPSLLFLKTPLPSLSSHQLLGVELCLNLSLYTLRMASHTKVNWHWKKKKTHTQH